LLEVPRHTQPTDMVHSAKFFEKSRPNFGLVSSNLNDYFKINSNNISDFVINLDFIGRTYGVKGYKVKQAEEVTTHLQKNQTLKVSESLDFYYLFI
jgi:hypothetical protein